MKIMHQTEKVVTVNISIQIFTLLILSSEFRFSLLSKTKHLNGDRLAQTGRARVSDRGFWEKQTQFCGAGVHLNLNDYRN